MAVALEDDRLAIGREARPAVEAGHIGHRLRAAPARRDGAAFEFAQRRRGARDAGVGRVQHRGLEAHPRPAARRLGSVEKVGGDAPGRERIGVQRAVRLGYRRELEAVSDLQKREALYQNLVAQAYAQGEAVNVAAHLEVDAVIDPAETRDWLLRALQAAPYLKERREGGLLDPW